MRHPLVNRALENAIDTVGAQGVAEATAHALSVLFAALDPLIGEIAIRAVYIRSLHLAKSSFERPGPQSSSIDALLDTLRRDLATRAFDDARLSAVALLDSMTALLGLLIGDPLINRLLQSAWGSPAGDTSETE
jgi:hypothetical protein